MLCPKCGVQLDDDSLFCKACGATVSESTLKQKKRQASSMPPWLNRLWYGYAAVAFIPALLSLYLLLNSNNNVYYYSFLSGSSIAIFLTAFILLIVSLIFTRGKRNKK